MITNFKLFESIEELKIEKFSYWIIYGSQYKCIEILYKLQSQLYLKKSGYNLYSDIERIINHIKIDINNNKYPDIDRTIFCFQNGIFMYGPVKNNFEKNRTIMSQLSEYNFKGEIKEVDDKIVVDTLEVDVNKYNL